MSDIAENYPSMPDAEIIRLYGQIDSLPSEAKDALRAEAARRGLTDAHLIAPSSPPANPAPKPAHPSVWSSYWPKMDSRDSAIKALNTAGGFAAFQAVVTGIIAVTAIVLHHPIIGLDGWTLIDTALMGIVSWRLYKLSFVWAIVAVLYQSANVVERAADAGTGLIVSLAFLLIYIGAVRGAAYLRKHRNDAPQST